MKINKYPFFLWLTQKRDDLKLNLQEMTIESEELGKSSLKEVPVYLIAILKYLPFLLIIPFLYYPTNKSDLLPFVGAFLVVGLMFFVYIKFENLLKYFAILLALSNFFLIFIVDEYAVFLDTGITFFVEIGLFTLLILDIFYFKAYKNWYFIENFRNEVNIKVANKKERKFLFWKKNVGFDVKSKFYIKGYFIRITDEDIK